MIALVDVVKLVNFVSIFTNEVKLKEEYKEKKIQILVQHPVELGAEYLHGDLSNNPLYQLAEEYNLIDINDSKIIS